MFLLASMLLFVDAAAGGANADGTLPANASPALRVLQTAAGTGIVTLMGVMATWIAFGRGERHFSETVALPFAAMAREAATSPGESRSGSRRC